ncbi:MAG: haloperoxidase, partial [Flavobacterium sp.]
MMLQLACSTKPKQYDAGINDISKLVTSMTEMMVTDVTNPPLAARFFAYTMMAGYEVAVLHDASLPALTGHIKE